MVGTATVVLSFKLGLAVGSEVPVVEGSMVRGGGEGGGGVWRGEVKCVIDADEEWWEVRRRVKEVLCEMMV